MNRFDEFAVEEALTIKESVRNTRVDAITVGRARSSEVLRRALGLGATHAVHITLHEQGYVSPIVVASLMASYAGTKSYDLILAGVMSEDLMQGQVGPMIAGLMRLPCATATIMAQVSPDLRFVYAEREIEGGLRDCVELMLPAVLTVQSGINRPRYPSLSNMLRAKRQELETIDASSLESIAPREEIVGLRRPERSRRGRFLEGTTRDKAAELLHILRDRALVK
jgi:electron transfer flavoprotein beta subunit